MTLSTLAEPVLRIPRLRGTADIMPISHEQFEQLNDAGIVGKVASVEWTNGYLVCRGAGQDYRWTNQFARGEIPTLDGNEPLWPFTADEFQKAISLGVLPQSPRTELIEGYIVLKDQGQGPGMGQGIRHTNGIRRALGQFRTNLAGPWMIQSQLPIRIGPPDIRAAGSEPEPDVSVADGPEKRYASRHPEATDVRLIVEVADSSLLYDSTTKLRLYATAGIPLYWIVNLVDRRLEAYRDPDTVTGEYRKVEFYNEDQSVVLAWEGLDPVTFAVAEFLP